MEKPVVKFEEFQRLDLRVGRIIAVERMEKSEKMLKLTVNIGKEERIIVAGIAGHYDADELIGQKVVVLLNIAPRKILGVESQGMILAAEDGVLVSLLKPDKDVSEGSIIG